MSNIRALGLVSGGLDSTLAVKLMLDQGIEVIGVNFNTGFCISDTRRQVRRRKDQQANLRHEALRAGSDLNFPVEIVDVSQEYLRIVTNPRWGYGKNANPCVDCRIMMLRHAWALMPQFDAKFVFTGEVIGQRPMTQHRFTMRQIEKQSGMDGLLLRPLSALRLPETQPEKIGWVDRNKLKGITGRSRKPQLALAVEFGLTDFPQPAGGCCFLTDPAFGRKFFDYLQHIPKGYQVTLEDFVILKVGRHLRLQSGLKMVVGRDEAENNFLESYLQGRWALRAKDVVGPVALLDGGANPEELHEAACILARYSDGRDFPVVAVQCQKSGREKILSVVPLTAEVTSRMLII
jgi:tRNA U34 2-thiouridine synthase MnmA/TrmU